MISSPKIAKHKAEVSLAKDINLRPQGVLVRLAILRGLKLSINNGTATIMSGNM
jgi:hypothetical protein